jgi:hypothetical protein
MRRLPVTPDLPSKPRAFTPRLPFKPLHDLLDTCRRHRRGPVLAAALRAQAVRAEGESHPWSLDERAVCLVLADLAGLGWQFAVARQDIYITPRVLSSLEPREAKEVVRDSLREHRAKQLAHSSVGGFLAGMHAPRLSGNGVVSIEQLIDDGARLAPALRAHRLGSLSEVVRPYLQLADPGQRCEHTGLNLADVWRYFRHTWSLKFKSTPGRTINFLIRNAARPFHPVMGIVGLANAVFQLSCRDEWVGWTHDTLVARLVQTPAFWPKFRAAALKCLQDARESVRRDDLVSEAGRRGDRLQFAERLKHVALEQAATRKRALEAEEAARKLKAEGRGDEPGGKRARGVHRLPSGDRDWMRESEDPLFKRKRADALADILFAEHYLEQTHGRATDLSRKVAVKVTADGAVSVDWRDPELGRAVAIALREIKKNGVATRLLDVNVCGATPVYRELLGGKLAAMALFAREIRMEYERQYGRQASEIASAMAGRAVYKDTDLCVLTTTSLYGSGSSQYNRVRYPYDQPVLRWRQIGTSEGYGTSHISEDTVDALQELATTRRGLKNVNHKFGEGTSALLRSLREGLEELGFEPNFVLRHGQARLVYAAELYPGARDDLVLNRASDCDRPTMSDIAAEWTRRWLAMRVQSDDVLARVEAVRPECVRADIGVPDDAPVQHVMPLR